MFIVWVVTGLPVTPNGVSLMTDPMGNATGEAFVQFANQSVADVALKKHMERIGHRWGVLLCEDYTIFSFQGQGLSQILK